ncbi:ribosome hibernation-promoting factor, HPF/YfiA family [Rubritalea sp.]|uniref:ribosome hibernation-promoting factor, HPF/YfiA family n=1 Tax=Rubritalea sp. TaxID=2109375 RepID=UPI003EF4E6F7
MQTANVDPPINIVVRHETITDAIRDFVEKKIGTLHLDYPRIIEARAVLDVKKNRHVAEIILFCANHITIDASTEGPDMYAAIDETISKIARRMRKHKTRLLKKYRGSPEETIRHLDERVYAHDVLDTHPEESQADPEPMIIHRETQKLKRLFKEEAIMELELSDKPFVVYTNARRDILQIVYRRSDGDYAIIEP